MDMEQVRHAINSGLAVILVAGIILFASSATLLVLSKWQERENEDRKEN
jgi:hypothetical protein